MRAIWYLNFARIGGNPMQSQAAKLLLTSALRHPPEDLTLLPDILIYSCSFTNKS
jgi:hypothetical protein